eukprot:5969949-Alexandrium_andersonii.AAC.1
MQPEEPPCGPTPRGVAGSPECSRPLTDPERYPRQAAREHAGDAPGRGARCSQRAGRAPSACWHGPSRDARCCEHACRAQLWRARPD